MKLKAIIASSIVTLGAVGTVTAFAATNGSSANGTNAGAPTATDKQTSQHHRGKLPEGTAGIAKFLGIDEQTLRADLKSGQSLSEIAQGQNKTEQDLVNFIESSAKSKLDQAVQNGKLTQAQETKRLQALDAHVTQMVEHKGPFVKAGKGDVRKLLPAVAKALGVTPQTLMSDLKSGQTISDVAQSKGVSQSTLVSQLKSDLQNRLDKLVGSGKLTAAKEQTILSNFDNHIGQVLTHKFNQSKTSTPATTGQSSGASNSTTNNA
ncbi:hypothetical protein [Alicyclobacillus dauci]|uniref:LysM domain-containing protein n=1 Tax=Alicyclobacillus dauci TaxID=1475485 RepID=A0ABY6Z3I7_9BACL|nr:hypothetical protein [Alicyclobacillus dauci]WAH36545.1 hypothetical protein NZD86_20425 [Alicyclobacillus dauci]